MKRVAILVVVALFFHHQSICNCNSTDSSAKEEKQKNVVPYILFTTLFGIHRLYLNASNNTLETLVRGSGFGEIDYHYRFDQMFWINKTFNLVMQAKLSDGSAMSILINRTFSKERDDISVDWINDKLYWVDSDPSEIGVYDLRTGLQHAVLSIVDSIGPWHILVYPYPDYGWLFWTDKAKKTLNRATVLGSSQRILRSNLSCVGSLSIDFHNHTVYFTDRCMYIFRSMSISGKGLIHSFSINREHLFADSFSIYGKRLYWAEPDAIFSSYSFISFDIVLNIVRVRSLQVVHPSKQPPVNDYLDIILDSGNKSFECNPECDEDHGTCIPAGLCVCEKGWIGEDCSQENISRQTNSTAIIAVGPIAQPVTTTTAPHSGSTKVPVAQPLTTTTAPYSGSTKVPIAQPVTTTTAPHSGSTKVPGGSPTNTEDDIVHSSQAGYFKPSAVSSTVSTVKLLTPKDSPSPLITKLPKHTSSSTHPTTIRFSQTGHFKSLASSLTVNTFPLSSANMKLITPNHSPFPSTTKPPKYTSSSNHPTIIHSSHFKLAPVLPTVATLPVSSATTNLMMLPEFPNKPRDESPNAVLLIITIVYLLTVLLVLVVISLLIIILYCCYLRRRGSWNPPKLHRKYGTWFTHNLSNRYRTVGGKTMEKESLSAHLSVL